MIPDEFTVGYMQAIWFTETERLTQEAADEYSDTTNDKPLVPGAYLFSGGAEKEIEQVCKDFQILAADELSYAYEVDGYDKEQAGIDFWLTRNRHGAGFWDRGLGRIGDVLTEFAKTYGTSDAILLVNGEIDVT